METLIRNGSVWTGNGSQPRAEAVAVLDGRIAAVGRDADARARIGRDAVEIDAAVSIRMEDRLGSLEVGKLADIAILDGNLHATEPAKIRDIPIWKTILGGEALWSGSAA
ncbi:MAG TPA: amidohydrolase family protein [Thermomicrobiales bacterium]|nr:amidohydrolase family protein [Thermomicrobiales bacterium]